MTITVEVYEADATTLVDTIDPGQFLSPTHTEAMNLAGSGSIQLPHKVNGVTNPAIALAVPGRIIRLLDDATPIGQFAIEQPSDVIVATQAHAGEILTVAGGDPLAAAFDKCYWQPDRGYEWSPFHPLRPLSFAADRLRDDDPAGPQGVWPLGVGQTPDQDGSNWFGRGIGYYDTVGPAGLGPEWIAAFDSRVPGAPAGIQFYRQRVELDDEYDVLIQWLFDDEGEGWVDNVPGVRATGIYKGGCNQTRMTLSAGEHLIAGFVNNLNAQRIGVAFAGLSIVDGQVDELLFRSDATACRVLAYPVKPPGFTPTEVIRLGWDEGQDRGMLTDVVLDFLSATDTDGAAMTEVTDLVVKAPGESLFTTRAVLAAAYLDFIGDRESLTLKAYKRGTLGTDRTATVQFGPGNCASLTVASDHAEQATVALVTVDGQPPEEVIHPDEADLGRTEVPLDFGAISMTTAKVLARRYLDEISVARSGITLELTPGLGPVPFDDFDIGDTVATVAGVGTAWGPDPMTWGDDPASWTDAHRVTTIQLQPVGTDSIKRYKVELDQPKAILEERLAMIMRRQLPASNGGRTMMTTTPQPTAFDQENGREHTETWSTPATGEVVIRKNGVDIAGSAITVGAGDPPGHRTLLDPARQYVPTVDKVDFTVGGVAGFPAPWSPPEGSWLLAVIVTAEDTGLTIELKYA